MAFGIKKFGGKELSGGIGQETEYFGEIFNDYELNEAQGGYTHAEGHETTAGITGYYYSDIDFTGQNPVITLSVEQNLGVSLEPFNIGFEVNDIISIVNNSKYPDCAKIIAVNNNVITVDSLPFNSVLAVDDIAVDDYSLFVASKPRVGAVSLGWYAHAEGEVSSALERASHAEGRETIAYGQYSHTEGRGTKAGYSAHAEGYSTHAQGQCSHTEGTRTQAIGNRTHAEGYYTEAIGENSHAEGTNTIAEGVSSHAEGWYSESKGNHSHAEGYSTKAQGNYSHTEGYITSATKEASHAEGYGTDAVGNFSHAEGELTKASGVGAHSEGYITTASGLYSHAEGHNTTASGGYAHAEGTGAKATGNRSHAEGYGTVAQGGDAHAEGYVTKALGDHSHTEGMQTVANGAISHAEGYKSTTGANAKHSHAEGCGTIADSQYQHVQGKYNIADSDNQYAHIVGNGASDTSRKNIHTLDWDGNAYYGGDVYVNSEFSVSGANGDKVATEAYVDEQISNVLGVYMQVISFTMTTDGWVDTTYNKIEELYPGDQYNVEVFFDGKNGTLEKKETYDNMELVGSPDDNLLYMYGDISGDVDQTILESGIPLILKVVAK